MPRNAQDQYYHPPGTEPASGESITAEDRVARDDAIKDDLNTARPIAVGGTGATTAAGARTNLDVPARAEVPLVSQVNTFTATQHFQPAAEVKATFGGTNIGQMDFRDALNVRFAGIKWNFGAGTVALSVGSGALTVGQSTLTYNGNVVYHAGNLPAGGSTMTASEILSALKTVDGSGSGLDADMIDGQLASAFVAGATTTGTPNGINSVTFAQNVSGGTLSFGNTVSATKLRPASVTSTGTVANVNTPYSGTWRCMGYCPNDAATVFVRVS